MGVYAALRCHYGQPLEKRIVHFDEPSILAVFDRLSAEEVAPYCEVREWFADAVECRDAAWTDLEDLRCDLEGHYGGGIDAEGDERQVWIAPDGGALQVLTERDQVLQIAMYVFTDEFAYAHPERVAFLLHDSWRLGAAESTPGGFSDERAFEYRGQQYRAAEVGTPDAGAYTFFTHQGLWHRDGDPLACGGNRRCIVRIGGARLPDLPRLFAEPADRSWPLELLLLRSQLLASEARSSRLSHVQQLEQAFGRLARLPLLGFAEFTFHDGGYLHDPCRILGPGFEPQASDYFLCQSPTVAGDGVNRFALGYFNPKTHPELWPDNPEQSRIMCSEHVAQASIPIPTWPEGVFEQWVLIDDVWVARHPHMAESLLRFFASRRVLETPSLA